MASVAMHPDAPFARGLDRGAGPGHDHSDDGCREGRLKLRQSGGGG